MMLVAASHAVMRAAMLAGSLDWVPMGTFYQSVELAVFGSVALDALVSAIGAD
ncbi:hypothetical protein [Cupriavidus pinatubonensis]|uniref:Uncharacterized protein n=1 Tax=Cupriavidus pinatubonensis TaxID=248026 RepID=A0ABM8WQY6_9BURK|nr:hypothetical protein [Cupriavidus pinatubonensis]CAG9169863.1 hypothetical protein LMG23994_01701 [Cupriavidus pinatubonensis]